MFKQPWELHSLEQYRTIMTKSLGIHPNSAGNPPS
jgi:hypothetical protein